MADDYDSQGARANKIAHQKKNLLTAYFLWWAGSALFFHRLYLGEYRATLLALAAYFLMFKFANYGSVIVGVWVFLCFVLRDAFILPKLVDRKNQEIAGDL